MKDKSEIELQEFFKNTRFEFNANGIFYSMRIDVINLEVEKLLKQYNVETGFFITAFNPGFVADTKTNLENNLILQKEIENHKLIYFKGIGIADTKDENPHFEDSFFVLGINDDFAYGIAEKYKQLAYVLIKIGEAPDLRWVKETKM